MNRSRSLSQPRVLGGGEAHWIPLSDLMTGMMMLFMLIAVVYMLEVEKRNQKITEVAIAYSQLKDDIYLELEEEFRNDLPRWGAELSREDLTLRFREPSVLFAMGSSSLRPSFQAILRDFFPRYIAILSSEKYKSSVKEIRIEGHTSSVWAWNVSAEDSYFLNMQLSQERTRTTLSYILRMPSLKTQAGWLQEVVTANGLSFSKLVRDKNGNEDQAKSQRVEFRVVTNSEVRLAQILEMT